MTAASDPEPATGNAAAEQPAPPARASKAPALLFGGLYALLAIPSLLAIDIPAAALLTSLLIAAALVTLSVIDLRTMRLPDVITLPLIAAGPLIAWAFAWDDPLWRAVSAAAGFLGLYAVAEAYRALRGRAGLGMGDAKLFAAAGAWLGMGALPSVLLWACGVALAGVLLALAFGRNVQASTRIPFGPFLAFGFWMVWLHGPL